MRWLRAVGAEMLGLFVDDAVFACAILAWLVLAGLLVPRLGLQPWADGAILFGGLIGILLESAIRRARN